jgi:hypothetical protein
MVGSLVVPPNRVKREREVDERNQGRAAVSSLTAVGCVLGFLVALAIGYIAALLGLRGYDLM